MRKKTTRKRDGMQQRTQLAKKEGSCDCPKMEYACKVVFRKKKCEDYTQMGKRGMPGKGLPEALLFPSPRGKEVDIRARLSPSSNVSFTEGAITSCSACLSFPRSLSHTTPHTPLWRSQCPRCYALLLRRRALAEVQLVKGVSPIPATRPCLSREGRA